MEDRPPAPGQVIERALLAVHVVDEARGRLRLVGEADLASSDAIVDGFDVVVAAGASDVALDCSELTYLDSSAIRALIYGTQVVPGTVTIERPTPGVARILDAMALGEVFQIVEG